MYELTKAADGADDASKVASHPTPSLLLTAAELGRWLAELGWGTALAPVLPRHDVGQGRPVLIVPGFMAGDGLTRGLRSHLRARGFRVHGWGLGRNYGLTDTIIDGLAERFDQLYARYQEPIILVGWSFGGLLCRWLAHRRPEAVSHVACLGSPWRAEGERTRVTALFERAANHYGLSDRAHEILELLRSSLPVPCTAIFSRTDGILHWRSCTVDGPDAENVPVLSSHIGLVSNPLALAVLTDRLSIAGAEHMAFSWRRCLHQTVFGHRRHREPLLSSAA